VVGLGERQPCLDEEDTAFAEDIAPVAVRIGGLVLDPLGDKKPEGKGIEKTVDKGSRRADWCSTEAVDTVPVDWGRCRSGRCNRGDCWTFVGE
jgi:hypothetical protein